jgi:phosphatidylserine/phosphatidylglycerophosphate/cardiolipin synthase-like enzyme
MKRWGLLLLLSALMAPAPAQADAAVSCKVKGLFHSQGNIGVAVIEELRQARSSLLLALYGFDNWALAEELGMAVGRGVSVNVKIDAAKSNEKREAKIVAFLKRAGVRVQPVALEGRNHNKFAVIDRAKVITGSYNWTLKAERNWENVLILDCPEMARVYAAEWEKIE